MPRSPRGKRTENLDGTTTIVAKNPNGDGSVYFEPPTTRSDGRQIAGRWRATWTDHNGKVRRVSARTRAEAEAKRDAKATTAAAKRRPSSLFGPETTIAELCDWWLENVARHRVKTSTYDSYRRFASYLSNDIGAWIVKRPRFDAASL